MKGLTNRITQSLTAKVVAALSLMLLLAFASVGAVYVVVQAQQADGIVIDETGRLRMLSQKLTKAALAVAIDGNEDARGELRAATEQFETRLDAVRYGAPERGIPPAPSSMSAPLDAIETLWRPFRADVERLLEASPASNTFQQAVAGVRGQNLELLRAADTAVTRFEQAASAKATTLYAVLFLLLGLNALAFGAVLVVLRRAVIAPILSLDEKARRIAEGDLGTEVDVHSEDEVGRLAASFNRMIETVRAGQDELAAEKANVEQKVDEATQALRANRQRLDDHVSLILQAMDRFAQGDLTAQVPEDADGAMGKLFRGFNRAVQNVRDAIREVQDVAQTSAATAGQVSASTDQLAAGAEEQSAQADEVAAAMEEMSRTIVSNAETATSTAKLANANGQTAQENGEIILETVEKMQELGTTVSESAATVGQLGASSQQIGEIVATIDEIADQTNLLALNAAIEAARAGKHGKGFAVVADEVRELAERTAGATSEIDAMITSIQEETDAAVQAMARGRAEVQSGIALADRARQAFEDIVADTTRVNARVGEIAAATEEQSATSEQISRSVEAISTVSQTQAQASSEIAQVIDALSGSTDDLRSLVERFDVGLDAASSGTPSGDSAQAGSSRPAATFAPTGSDDAEEDATPGAHAA